MGLFNKKKEETNSCCCVGNCTPKTMAKTEASKSGVGVKVLGSGCVKCKTLENATREALVELGIFVPACQTKCPPKRKTTPGLPS